MQSWRPTRLTAGTVLGAASVLLAAGCSSPSAPSVPTSPGAGTMGSSPTPADSGPVGPTTPSAAVAPSASVSSGPGVALLPPPGLAWSASPGSDAVQVATTAHGTISFLHLDPTRLRFRFVPGSAVPVGGPATAADHTPSSWVPGMVAAFNSGYKLSDHVGGYYYLGRTVAALRDGLASMVVHRDGSLAIGVWGKDISMTPDTLVVRQNLPPLVVDGVSQASPTDKPRTWGISNGNRPLANRSALARLADGSFVYVYAHLVTADTLGRTLVASGAQMAIMLDMNVSWPTGFVYSHPGGHVVGAKINSYTVRSPTIYLTQFKKDFIAVERT